MPLQIDHNNTSANRVAQAIYLYAEQEAQLKISSPWASSQDAYAISLKRDYYLDVYQAYKKKPSKAEKGSLIFIRHELGKMDALLRPSLLKKLRYSPLINLVINFLNNVDKLFTEHYGLINDIQKEQIREHNLQALSESMKKTGFKLEMEGTLKKMIAQDLPQFHIRYADVQHRKADFVLHFKKIPGSDVYYFEKFDAAARPNLDAVLKKEGNGLWQTFSLTAETCFTAAEATHLVNGKSVCKHIDGKETWLVLETSGINQPGAFRNLYFDIDKALKKLPIKGLDNPAQYKAITDALKMGATKEVTLTLNGHENKYYLSAAPLRKTLDVLDKDHHLIDLTKLPGAHLPEMTQKLTAKLNQSDNVIELPTHRKGNRV